MQRLRWTRVPGSGSPRSEASDWLLLCLSCVPVLLNEPVGFGPVIDDVDDVFRIEPEDKLAQARVHRAPSADHDE